MFPGLVLVWACIVARSHKVEKKFRLKVVEKFGGRKGALYLGAEEAIRLWLKS